MRFTKKWTHSVLASILIALVAVSTVGCSQSVSPTAGAPSQTTKSDAANAPKPANGPANEAKPADAAKPANEAKQEAPKLVKLRVPYAAVSGVMAPLWISKEKGLFEKYGLDVEVQYIASSTTLTQSMLSGEIQVAETAANPVVAADLAGADLVIVAGTANVLALSLYTQPTIGRVEDLKGKAVGVSRFGSSTDFGARQTLRRYGLQPPKDVAILETGGAPETIGGLQAGRIQGAVFGPPSTLKAKQLGMKELVNIADLNIPYSMTCFAVSKKYLAQNRETVKSFLKAIVEGIAVTKSDKEFAMNVIGKYTQTEDKAVLEETYQYYMTKILPRVPYMTAEAAQSVLEDVGQEIPKAKDAKAETFIDNSILKELDDSGFIKKLYGE